jgi:hypothetical protein
MRARYLGDHDNFTAWELRFPRGVFVRIDDPAVQAKIRGNNHFEVEQIDADDVEFIETPRAVAPEAAQEPERTKRQYNRRK